MILQKLYDFFVAIIAPPYCYACKFFLTKPGVLCNECQMLVKPIASIKIPITAGHNITVHAISAYNDPLKKIILAKVYCDKIASCDLAELMWNKIAHISQSFDYIVAIPLHWSRFSKRGFNQAEVIARILSGKSKKPMVNLLRRHVNSVLQSRLSSQKRFENVKDIFQLIDKNPLYKNKNILLVDDLMTTGATLIAASKELIKLKPKSIQAIVACRVV